MFVRIVFTLILAALFSALAVGQTTPASTVVRAEPPKANARPTPAPVVLAEPFDQADVKTMAAKCVKIETETGDIEAEMYPESAPESVRNFLNLVATGSLDTTAFTRVVPGFVIQGGDLYSREGKITYAMQLCWPGHSDPTR